MHKALKIAIWTLVGAGFIMFLYNYGNNFTIVIGLSIFLISISLAVLKPDWFLAFIKWFGLAILIPVAIMVIPAVIGVPWLFLVLFPLYIVILLILHPKIGIVVLLVAGVLLIMYFAAGPEWMVREDSALGQILISQRESFARSWENIRTAPQRVKESVDRQRDVWAGNLYTGKVDEGAKEQLGVYLENFKAAEPRFYEDGPVTLFATLKARTFDKVIKVRVNCSVEGIPATRVLPKAEYEIEVYEEQGIDCSFRDGLLKSGTYKANMSADFDFKTLGYVKSYFIDKERLRAFRRENVDPLQQYGIEDRDPTAIYTQGPVRLGMKAEVAQPFGVDRTLTENGFILGITLENAWQGMVTKVKNLTIIIPKGFELTDVSNRPIHKISCYDLPLEDQEGCDDGFVEVYTVMPSVDTFQKYITFRAHIITKRQDYPRVIGEAPISTKYFNVIADYDYRLEANTVITVMKREGYNRSIIYQNE